jgi:hypothetical protein
VILPSHLNEVGINVNRDHPMSPVAQSSCGAPLPASSVKYSTSRRNDCIDQACLAFNVLPRCGEFTEMLGVPLGMAFIRFSEPSGFRDIGLFHALILARSRIIKD